MPTKVQRLRIYLSKALQVVEELCADEELGKLADSRRDSKLIADLHRFAWCSRQQSGGLIHRSRLIEFMCQRCTLERAEEILALTCSLGWLSRNGDWFDVHARGHTAQQDSSGEDEHGQ